MAKMQVNILRGTLEMMMGAEKAKEINYVIHVGAVADQVSKLRVKLGQINKENAFENASAVFVDLLELLFGKENANEIIGVYDGDIIALLPDIAPFLKSEIFPAFDAMRERLVASKKALRNG